MFEKIQPWRFIQFYVKLSIASVLSLVALYANAQSHNDITLDPITNLPVQHEKNHVVLISLDGFRHDYIELHDAKNLARIAKAGVRSTSLTPVYPANTFPNHISIITGLLPINHGIIDNRFYAKSRPDSAGGYAKYSMGKAKQDSSWITALPLWHLAEFQGHKAATFFWPESDARIAGALPTYLYHYSKYADYQQRIDQIVQWLRLPEASRPLFVAGYFSLTDTVGHDEGPTSSKTKEAVAEVDELIGQLYDRLNTLPIKVDLVIVSDHGMTTLKDSHNVMVESLDIPDYFTINNSGALVRLYAHSEVSPELIADEASRLNAVANGQFNVLTTAERNKRQIPYNERTGDIIIEISPPGRFRSEEDIHVSKGGHGYLNTLPDMGGLFVASGPSFEEGKTVPAFSNLEIYPALAEIMGLELLTTIDGEIDVLRQGLR
ncbi:ectonucleotide pyrophosphatase/phosphodiesterase [Alteromonas sp. CI.11.F.A3]|uniref:alkaline phosphatase family protein n=1 Tax=Alteromonas sp. CI.11.F.A3 TaxID=3079555 RepID=UPI002942D268|nr:ectonucleotide pyrophosphatase/phosphodiesterase [Alteromonas sp. CI.11.F.A3]WOI36943.1 ectonucleotide pyrophosphatase/phosphodiesterase [Alteromonas sp. CI.11.F.A3]